MWFQRRIVLYVVPIISIWKIIYNFAPGRGQFEPQGHDWQLNEEDYLTLLHTKYKSSGPHGLREDVYFMFSYCMTMGDDDPRGVANLDPSGMIGRIYVGYYLTLLHTKYTNKLWF